MSSIPDFKRRALETRRAHLIEEFEAANAQVDRALADVDRLRLQRTADDLERQIREIDGQLQGAPGPASSFTANPLGPEPDALVMARRALAILETQAGAYTAFDIPVHLQLSLEEKRKQVAELEIRWRAGNL